MEIIDRLVSNILSGFSTDRHSGSKASAYSFIIMNIVREKQIQVFCRSKHSLKHSGR